MTAPAVEMMATDAASVMDAVLSSTKAESLTAETVVTPRNELGQFVSASGATTAIPPAQQPDAGSEVPSTGADVPADAATAEDAPAIPEGFVAAPALAEDKARGFVVRDAEGEIVPPDLTWELTANGKPRSLSTDKLVAYAQMGVYNHEREQQTQQVQQRAQQIEQSFTEVQATLAEREAQLERLLSDDDYFLQARDAFAQHNTPEARAQRERDELEQSRQLFQMQQAQQQAVQFLDGTMAPALEQVQQMFPTVTREELAAKMFLAADPYRWNGVLMPAGFDALRGWVVQRLVPEIQQLHEERSASYAAPAKAMQAERAAVDAKAKAVQVQSQKVKNLSARTLRPAGRAAPESAPEPVIRNQKDVQDVVLGRTMAAIRGG